MKPNKFFNLAFNVALAFILAAFTVQDSEAHVLAVSVGYFAGLSALNVGKLLYEKISLIRINDAAFMAVETEVWENFIAENLFKAYEWIRRAKDRTGAVINNKVVHIPQAGAKPTVRKNREVYPIPLVKRNDLDVTYAIDEFSTDSVLIPEADKVQLSYNKIESVFGDHVGAMNTETARDLLWRWYPSLSSNIKRTTGAAVVTHLGGSATGNRKKFTVADVATAKTELIKGTKRETNPGKRALIMREDMYNQLKSDTVLTDKDTVDSVGGVWKDGDLIKVHGFDIIRTDVTGIYDNTGTPVLQDPGDAIAAADNDVVLLVDFSFVHFAMGEVKFFESINDVHYQGDVYNAYVRLGGRKERSDEVGVVAIVQAAE